MNSLVKKIQKKAVDFIERVRASSEPAKRFWIVIASGAAVVVMLFLWGAYNKIIDASPTTKVARVVESGAAADSGPGLFDRLGANISSGIRVVRDVVSAKNKVVINAPREANFIFDDLESVPSTLLP